MLNKLRLNRTELLLPAFALLLILSSCEFGGRHRIRADHKVNFSSNYVIRSEKNYSYKIEAMALNGGWRIDLILWNKGLSTMKIRPSDASLDSKCNRSEKYWSIDYSLRTGDESFSQFENELSEAIIKRNDLD